MALLMGFVGQLIADERDDHQDEEEADEDDASDEGEHLRLLTNMVQNRCETGGVLLVKRNNRGGISGAKHTSK